MKPRRVALNALFLDPGVSGGTETYLRELGPALAALPDPPELVVFTTRRGASALASDGWHAFARLVRLRTDEGQRLRRLAGEQVAVPHLARERGCDVLHSLANTGPVRPRLPHVLTIHDVHFFTLRALGRVSSFGHRQVVGRAARHADVLIAITTAARDEIADVLELPRANFAVVPHGAQPPRVAPARETEVRRRLRLGNARVVLCVAAKRPHKNQELLLRALPLLPADVVVVLAGHAEAYDVVLRRLAHADGLAERVRFADYVPDDELEALWAMAACAALPTRGEGFGLPVVEAMVRGVPLACSDLPVLREVGEDVPHYFDPDDPAAAAAAIRAAMEDVGADRRGRERAAAYSWAEAARLTRVAYARALAPGRPAAL